MIKTYVQKKLLQNHQQKVANIKHPQAGASFLSTLIILAAMILIGITAMRMFPAYSEFHSVKSLLKSMTQEPLNTMNRQEIMSAFDRRMTSTYVTTVSGKDLTIDKRAGDTVLSVNYQVIKPLFGNVSVVMDFSAASNDD